MVISKLSRKSLDFFVRKILQGLIGGPSNIGNYLTTMGIDATYGYGVRYKNIHAGNESVEITSINKTFNTYIKTIELVQ